MSSPTKKTYFNWSSGKDSALALFYLLQDKNYRIDKLITTVTQGYDRVTMHGLRTDLLLEQTKAIGIEVDIINLPDTPSMEAYENTMLKQTLELKSQNFTHSAFGDIFLEDLKAYRESQLHKIGIETVFPLWKKDTTELINTFLSLGFKAVIVAASAKYFNEDVVGKTIDSDFIKTLPKDVDPCGENGEFHTFCYNGPIFKYPVDYTIGEKVYREYNTPKTEKSSNAKGKTGFWYCDLIAKNHLGN